MNAREAAFTALRRVDDGAYSSIVIGAVLDKSGLSDRDKALASMIFYGVLENELLLEYILKEQLTNKRQKIEKSVKLLIYTGLYQLGFMDRIPDSAAVNETVTLAKKCGLSRASGFINAVLRAYIRSGKRCELPDRDKMPLLYFSVKYSCPASIIKLWRDAYGEELCEDILRSLPCAPPIFARVNTTLTDTDSLASDLSSLGVDCAAVPGIPDCLSIGSVGDIESLEPFARGQMHVQDMSSQLCCMMLGAAPGEKILDVCSAPGGKAFTIAELMGDTGEVIACDIHPHRVELIRSGAERLHLRSVKPMVRDALSGGEIAADRVLCDVPCSGLGVIRRKPDIKNKAMSEIAGLPALQYDILCASAKSVRSGGVLVYSTCTLNPRENGDIISRFLSEHDDFQPMPLDLPAGVLRQISEPEYMLTVFPHNEGGDGFFISRIRRKD